MSNQSPKPDTMTLAGLAAANSPWLVVRMQRLAEHAGVQLPMAVIEHAVIATSRVLGEVLDAEGRPVPSPDAASDPVAALGREQAKNHREAGLGLAASLKVQRLLRRAYDDLVRESWVERETRARAHEDVERFFERCLVGLVSTWSAQPAAATLPPGAEPARLLAQREDELRRALDAGKRLTKSLRQARAKADVLDAELKDTRARLVEAQAQAADGLAGLKEQLGRLKSQATESLTSMKAEFAQVQASAQAFGSEERDALNLKIRDLESERSTLGARLAELEMALAAHGEAEEARLEAQQEVDRARAEADRARAKAENAREELKRLQEGAQDLRNRAEADALAARAEAEGLRGELFTLREAHANLTSEAEAMRTRLSEAGSRLAGMRRAEEQEITARLAQAMQERDSLAAQLAQARDALRQDDEAKQQALIQARILRDERDEFSRSMDELSDRLKEAEARIIQLSGEKDRLAAELAEAQGGGQRAAELSRAFEAERQELSERLRGAEAQVISLSEDIRRARAALDEARAGSTRTGEQARAAEAERLDLEARLKGAEAQVISLTEALERARQETAIAQASGGQSAAQVRTLEDERQGLAERLKTAEAQIIRLSEDLSRSMADLAEAREGGGRAAEQAQAFESTRLDLETRLKAAESQVIRLSNELSQATEGQAAAEARQREAEQQSATALSRTGELLQEAQSQARRRLDEMSTERDTTSWLMAAHLSLTPDAVATLDGLGGFNAWNKRFTSLFGLSDTVLAGGIEAAMTSLCAAFQRPELLQSRLREILASPTGSEDGLTLATLKGETLVFRASTVRHDNRTAGRILNFRDVSLEHDMENLVREIESITRYELGQSVTAFIHLPQALLDDPSTTPAQAQKLAVIRDSGYRIVNTVNMAVDIFRMERGLFHMRPGSSMDLAVVARRAAKDVQQLAQSRHVDLELYLDQSPLPQDCALPASGDPILAHALAVNLLRDTLEAAPGKSLVSLVLHQDHTGLSLSVSRRGVLATDEVHAYFDKPLTQDADYGLRRGRYAAQLIARSLGGTLRLDSTAQAGTILCFTLPK